MVANSSGRLSSLRNTTADMLRTVSPVAGDVQAPGADPSYHLSSTSAPSSLYTSIQPASTDWNIMQSISQRQYRLPVRVSWTSLGCGLQSYASYRASKTASIVGLKRVSVPTASIFLRFPPCVVYEGIGLCLVSVAAGEGTTL